MTKELINLAQNKASQSSCRHKVSALGFDRKGNFVGSATNRPFLNKASGGIHAEKALLNKFGLKIKKILICRVGKSGQLRPIDPCDACKKMLDKHNIEVVKVAA